MVRSPPWPAARQNRKSRRRDLQFSRRGSSSFKQRRKSNGSEGKISRGKSSPQTIYVLGRVKRGVSELAGAILRGETPYPVRVRVYIVHGGVCMGGKVSLRRKEEATQGEKGGRESGGS